MKHLINLAIAAGVFIFTKLYSDAISFNSIEMSGVNLVGHLLVMVFVIQWIAYIPAFIFKTEKFYDLTGSLTYDKTISANKNINIKIPLAGSLANVCTELSIPDLTKKVPHILRVNVVIDNITTHDVRAALLSSTTMQCNNAVNVSHGIKETFSTGSQNQKPPHPSS